MSWSFTEKKNYIDSIHFTIFNFDIRLLSPLNFISSFSERLSLLSGFFQKNLINNLNKQQIDDIEVKKNTNALFPSAGKILDLSNTQVNNNNIIGPISCAVDDFDFLGSNENNAIPFNWDMQSVIELQQHPHRNMQVYHKNPRNDNSNCDDILGQQHAEQQQQQQQQQQVHHHVGSSLLYDERQQNNNNFDLSFRFDNSPQLDLGFSSGSFPKRVVGAAHTGAHAGEHTGEPTPTPMTMPMTIPMPMSMSIPNNTVVIPQHRKTLTDNSDTINSEISSSFESQVALDEEMALPFLVPKRRYVPLVSSSLPVNKKRCQSQPVQKLKYEVDLNEVNSMFENYLLEHENKFDFPFYQANLNPIIVEDSSTQKQIYSSSSDFSPLSVVNDNGNHTSCTTSLKGISPNSINSSSISTTPPIEKENFQEEEDDEFFINSKKIKNSLNSKKTKNQNKSLKIEQAQDIDLAVNLQISTSSKENGQVFQCMFCPASFKVKGYLTRHMKKHLSSKAFVCPFFNDPECEVKTEEYNSSLKDFKNISPPPVPRGTKCHPTGGFSRRDTYKTHLKALHFIYPPGTKSNHRNEVGGRCAGCFQYFSNNNIWLNEHIEKNGCPNMLHKSD
ncbi:hypothetical protein PACTADRAFT_86902 [Pachysolen tannophilus NRRL Y-2460]|uniref:C2H2-type domain-containing protein n=1 Tax=Pachysolen tannophilus NRRL Y-2460 TaxID=669874 RepID=A0A1E4TQ19_PACTA|nr:hypothetical protein PACTADRAFT_86902 [Pachysolen tannophilus NRRL Y-2460]